MLQLHGVSKRFESDTRNVLSDINLEINEGEFVCILGPSGCGKSTLLNIVAGLEKPTEGQVFLYDQVVEGPSAERTMMFQESALFPWLTVEKNVEMGMKLSGVPKEDWESRTNHYLEMVNLLSFRKHRIHQLSGGMKQRVALARALAIDSPVLLMDEPFAALDKQTKNNLRDEIQSIWMNAKKTILYVTHSVEEALFFADRIVMLSSHPGEIKEIIHVDIERPRKIDSHQFVEIRSQMLSLLKKEIQKIEKEEFGI